MSADSFAWAIDGVDMTISGNGGKDCKNFIDLEQRKWESSFFALVGLFMMLVCYSSMRLPDKIPPPEARERKGKRFLLVLMCLTFGIELGFKLASRQFIWILNPCHITCSLQVSLFS